jgi:hypothetical protein
MLRRSSIVIGLLVLMSWPLVAKVAPDRTKEDCVEACVRKANPCYKKCETTLAKCQKDVETQCKKKPAGAQKECHQEGDRDCRDEKEINCDPQCSIKVLQCVNECQGAKPGS